MQNTIDARGLSCPEPIISAKKWLDVNSGELIVIADNAVVLENLKRLCSNYSYTLSSEFTNGDYRIRIFK